MRNECFAPREKKETFSEKCEYINVAPSAATLLCSPFLKTFLPRGSNMAFRTVVEENAILPRPFRNRREEKRCFPYLGAK